MRYNLSAGMIRDPAGFGHSSYYDMWEQAKERESSFANEFSVFHEIMKDAIILRRTKNITGVK